jgi:DMSO/TMAO reductase YedYZ heme-binding membrane subunit
VGVVTLVGGGVAYLIVLGMALTSNERSQRALEPVVWRRAHLLGSSYLVLIFAFTYLGRISTKPWVASTGLGALGVALLLRASTLEARRRADHAVIEKPSSG